MTGLASSLMNQFARLLAPALILLSLITMMFLASCGSGGGGGYVNENRTLRGYNPGVGPFDNQGNYVERWANDKSKGNWWRKSIVHEPVAPTAPSKPAVVAAMPKPTPTPKPSASTSSFKPKPSTPAPAASAATATAKPTVAITAKPKSKPPIRHVIKKGDTLWGLSRKYGTTVTAIQRANGLKGSNLRIGRTLLIPRY
ncbi:MAG: LysM peptidoglycan-binding domain-containing protein [Akkermansiaceae bacterium]